jgi:hypothetical protein
VELPQQALQLHNNAINDQSTAAAAINSQATVADDWRTNRNQSDGFKGSKRSHACAALQRGCLEYRSLQYVLLMYSCAHAYVLASVVALLCHIM